MPPPTRTQKRQFRLAAEFGHQDVTDLVAGLVKESDVRDGMVVVALTGSTGCVTTIESRRPTLAA